jgi:hypothetical protein
MDDLIGLFFGLALLAGVVYVAVRGMAIAFGYILSALYWGLGTLSYGLVAFLDALFGGVQSLSPLPVLAWAAWGGLLGGAIGFSTIAPVYGLKKQWRSAPALIVMAVMAGTALHAAVSVDGPSERISVVPDAVSKTPVVARMDTGGLQVRYRVNAPALHVQIEFLGEVWLEVTADDRVVLSGTRRAQDAPLVVTGSRVWMRLGRPQNVVLTINGQQQDRLPAGNPRNVVVELAAAPVGAVKPPTPTQPASARPPAPPPAAPADGTNFTTADPAPGVPILSSPAADATEVSRSTILAWKPVEGATAYRVQVARDAGFGAIVFDQTVSATAVRVTPRLSPGTQYWWRVSASNASGAGNWTAGRAYTTAAGSGE